MFSISFPKTSRDTHLSFKSGNFNNYNKDDFDVLKYSDFKDENTVIYLSNIFGKRIDYNHKNNRLHISDQFATQKDSLILK